MQTERLRFPGAFDNQLAARLEMPDEAPLAYALFAHCFTCSKDLKAVRRISKALVTEGVAVLSFDFTGLGESEGDFADTNFSSNLEDLVAAADFLSREHRPPEILVGHSLGGAAILAAADRILTARLVATIGAPSEPSHLVKALGGAADKAKASGEAEVVLAGRAFRIRGQLIDDLRAQRLEEKIGALRPALVIFHSPVDEVVSIDHAGRIYAAARHPKSFVPLDGADHLLLRNPRDSEFVGQILATWSRRYIGAPERRRTPALVPGEVLVEGGAGGYANLVWAGRHVLRADEPERLGGTDTGAGPYDFLLAGLGACTSMTLRMYADRKGWPLSAIRVRLRHSRIHAHDCEECETREGKVDRIEREIEMEGTLGKEQRDRLLEIADRCPVHRTLTSEINIRTKLAPS
jgi:putative redox protein